MGQTTPNMGIYIPAAGETNYDSSFAAGMVNIDQHDHSGGPNKGVPLSSSGIADGSITRNKLNANVVLSGGGLAVDSGSPNALKVDGVLIGIFGLASNGLIARTGATTAASRTLTGTSNTITVTNGDGASGNPTITIADNPILPGTASTTLPSGTTGQRPSPVNGMIRYNSTTNKFEGYENGVWINFGLPSGTVVGYGSTVYTTQTTGTTVIPYDNSIPQQTEGDEYITLAYTPLSATNKLVIEALVYCAATTTSSCSIALFQDATANALSAAAEVSDSAANIKNVSIKHEMIAGTTSPTTFKIRGGPSSGTFYINQGATVAAGLFGGVIESSLTITEIVP